MCRIRRQHIHLQQEGSVIPTSHNTPPNFQTHRKNVRTRNQQQDTQPKSGYYCQAGLRSRLDRQASY